MRLFGFLITSLSSCFLIYGVVQENYIALWIGIAGVWAIATIWVFRRSRGVKIDADAFGSDGGGGWGDGGGGD